MTAEAATLAGRVEAEALMVDTCTITRAAQGTFNETTLVYDSNTSTTVYTGKCRVKPRDNADRVVQFGQEAVSLLPYVVSVPMSVEGVAIDDLVTVTNSVLDPELVGKVLRIRQTFVGSHITARRFGAEVNEG
jgi:hypothetical protein